ncbi:MAG: nif-specific transcriptional activator NifA [Magnetococcales bacterium]|nr:nif-specific transcriptional activator NifA [Magnetococcales bacterium]
MRKATDFKNAALFHTTRNAFLSSQMETLYQVSQLINSSQDLSFTLKTVLEILDEHGKMGRGVIMLMDPETGGLLVQAINDGRPLPVKNVFFPPGEGMLGVIVSSGQAVIIEDPSHEPRFIRRLGLLDPSLPFIGVPIPLENQQVGGVIAVQPYFGSRELLRDQELLVEIVANLLAHALRVASRSGELAEIMGKTQEIGIPQKMTLTAPGFEQWMESRAMRPVLQSIVQAAKWDTVVLIQGESGTGKEMTASAIHQLSPRSDGPYVKVNCAALSDNLLESELFGHEKGAFTGAVSSRKGRFELADGGTLFLDEIGEISPAFQTRLLRVIQEGEFERVGGTRTLHTDVRIIAATNKDLYQEVQKGRFRTDLFYRLFVFPIQLPPLRDRREDIPWLAESLLKGISDRQKRVLHLSHGAMVTLSNSEWPGNVRELENTLERAAIMSQDGLIDAAHIVFPGPGGMVSLESGAGAAAIDINTPGLGERERVIAALEKSGWVQAKAARLLDMTPRQIAYRIKTLDIPVRHI